MRSVWCWCCPDRKFHWPLWSHCSKHSWLKSGQTLWRSRKWKCTCPGEGLLCDSLWEHGGRDSNEESDPRKLLPLLLNFKSCVTLFLLLLVLFCPLSSSCYSSSSSSVLPSPPPPPLLPLFSSSSFLSFFSKCSLILMVLPRDTGSLIDLVNTIYQHLVLDMSQYSWLHCKRFFQ